MATTELNPMIPARSPDIKTIHGANAGATPTTVIVAKTTIPSSHPIKTIEIIMGTSSKTATMRVIKLSNKREGRSPETTIHTLINIALIQQMMKISMTMNSFANCAATTNFPSMTAINPFRPQRVGARILFSSGSKDKYCNQQ